MPCPASRAVTAGFAALLILTASGVATAQAPQMPRENTRGTAVLKGLFAPGVLHVQNKEGDQLLLKVEAAPKDISFTGSADTDWLQPGMLVRFTARFNKKGQALQEISDLTVFSPREDSRIGVFPDSGLGGGELFGEDAEKKAKDESAPYLVAGQLTALRSGKMTVAAGGTTLKVELSDEAKVRFDLTDIRLARPGDSVSFEGWYYTAAKNQIFARRLEILASEPLSGEKKSRGRRVPSPTADGENKDEATKDGEKTEDGEKKDGEKKDGEKKEDDKKEGGPLKTGEAKTGEAKTDTAKQESAEG